MPELPRLARRRDRDAEMQAVTDELNDRMDEYNAAVSALTALLLETADPPDEAGERLATADG